MAPPIGLIGSEQALLGGQAGAESAIAGGLRGGVSALNAGNQGIDRQAALAGLRGNPAQLQAFQSFQQSPEQEFLRQQGEQALLRNQAAIGGIGGGNVRRELVSQGIGLAAQDFGNQFQRGQQVLGSQQALAPAAANLAFNSGQSLAQSRLGTSQGVAQGRFQTGSALSNLLSQQGAGAADIIGTGAANLAGVQQGAGAGDTQANQQLAAILANLATQQASLGVTPAVGGAAPAGGQLGGIGQLAGGLGGLIGSFSG